MLKHPLALQLRNLQTLVEIGVDQNSTVVVPAPLMSTIGELGTFLAHESAAAAASGNAVANAALPVPAPVGALRTAVDLPVEPERGPSMIADGGPIAECQSADPSSDRRGHGASG